MADLLLVRPSLLPFPLQKALFFLPPTDEKKMSLGDLSFFILHNLLSGIQVLVLLGPNKKCLSPGRRPSKQAAAGWEKRACQPRAAERVSHGRYLQPSKELQRLPIKTLLKHFWCCQQQRAEIAQRSLRCYLPSNSVVLSILWARRYEISNNLISTSKFHKLLEVAAPGTWAHRYQTKGPLWGDKDLYAEVWHKGPKYAHCSTQYSLGNVPKKELLECSSSEHH